MKELLDRVLERAMEKALASLEDRASHILEQALTQALEGRVKALLGGATPATPTPATATATATSAPKRARKRVATATPTPATPTPATAKARAKAKARVEVFPTSTSSSAAPSPSLEEILEGVRVALEKYRGITTPRGKPLEEVLFRRARSVLQYAQRQLFYEPDELADLGRACVKQIHADPHGVAMEPWPRLARRMLLPDPLEDRK